MQEKLENVVVNRMSNDLLKRKVRRALFIISFTILPVLAFLVFYVYVNLDSFVMAFQKPEGGKLVWAGFENFKWVFEKIKNGSTIETDDLRLAFINTFKSFGILMLMYPIGIINAYFVYKKI